MLPKLLLSPAKRELIEALQRKGTIVVTKAELIQELEEQKLYPANDGAVKTANHMINNIIARRDDQPSPYSDPCGDDTETKQWMGDEQITVEELHDAIRRFGWTDPSGKASRIFNEIKSHREPEWKTRDVVKDAYGVMWMRTSGNHWVRFASSAPFNDNVPKRPLKRMVEEA